MNCDEVDALFEAQERLVETLTAERNELREYARKATIAITGLTGGGSEFFSKRIGDMYTADLPYCVEHIKDRERRAHERWLTARRTALAQARKGEQP